MKMQLVLLVLENFKGHAHLTIRFDGKNANIYGQNGTGKTTIYDAFTWLLFGKDSKGDKDFGIKPVALDGSVKDSAAITSVEAALLVDGVERSLKRTYREVWSTKRGNVDASFDGHSSDYFVDDVPVKKNEFDRRVGEIVPEDKFKLLTSLFYFSKQLPWRNRRAALFDVAAVATDEEILASSARFEPLVKAMGGLALDDYRKKLTARRKGLNKSREDIPARLDECMKTVADLSHTDFAALERQKGEAKEKRAAVRQELDQAEHDGGRMELQNQLTGVRNELGRLENENDAYRLRQRAGSWEEETAQVRQTISVLRAKKSFCQKDLEYLRGRQKTLEDEIIVFRAQWSAIHGEQFRGGTCPTCGQSLPQDKLEASRAAFEKDKARRKDEIVNAANRAKATLKSIQEDVTRLEQEMAEGVKQAEELNDRLQELESTPKAEITDMEGYAVQKAELEARAGAIQEKLDGQDARTETQRRELQNTLIRLDRELERISGELSKKTALAYAKRRMEELREEAGAASNELNQLDGMLFLCEEFTRYKVQFIEESINRRFALVRFRLFREQINGGLEDCCDVLVKGAAVGDNLNTGAEFLAGVDIINTLSRCYGVYVPLFIDGAESVTEPLNAETQTIRLVVSETDKELRCELADGGIC